MLKRLIVFLCLGWQVSEAGTVTVPGSSNPWLAGAAAGVTASGGDVAPTQSPVLVEVNEGDELQFYVTGWAGYAPGAESSSEGVGVGFAEMSKGAENGIAGIDGVPANALIGVFLSDETPVAGGEPAAEDFSVASGRRNSTFRVPTLNVPFFIGNGVTASGERQTVAVPVGATRLFLGTVDGSGWFNNPGSFTVNVREVTPEASTNQVTWGTPTAVSGPADVATTGTLVLARDVQEQGTTYPSSVTLNGATFAAMLDLNGYGAGDDDVELTQGTTWNGPLGSTLAPFSALSEDYQTLLASGGTRIGAVGGRSFQLTMNNLVIGNTYTVQFWVNSSAVGLNPFDSNDYGTIIATPSGSVALDPTVPNEVGGVGQQVTGTFIANEPGITFTFTAADGGYPCLNAFQLRDVTPPGPTIAVTGPLEGNAEEELVYQIAVTNPGAVAEANLVVDAWLPSGTTKVSAPGSSTLFGGEDEGVTWSIPFLDAGEVENFTLTVRSATAQTLVPAAFAARAYLKKTGVGNLATADFPATVIGAALPPVVGATALAIAPNGKKGTTVGDQWATWTFNVTQPLQPDIVVTPPRLQYRSGENGSVWTDLPGALRRGNTPVAWTQSTAMPLSGGSYFFRVLTTRPGFSSRSFQAPGIYLVNGKSRLEVEVTRASEVDPESNRTRPGDIVRYDITVRNVGSTAAENVLVFGPVPAGMKDPVGSSAQLSTGPLIPNVRQRDSRDRDLGLTWAIPSLPPGATAVMNYSCIVMDTAAIGSLLQPTGVGAAEGVSPITSSKTFTAAVAKITGKSGARPGVLPVARVNAGLFIGASAGNANLAEVGGTITYTLTVQNLYNTARQEAVVWVRLPAGTQFASYGQASGLNFNGAASTLITTGTNPSLTRATFADAGVLTWNLGNMAARENRTLVFTVRVGAELPDTVVNVDGSTSSNEIRLVEYNFRTRGVSTPFYAYPRPTITDKSPLAANLLEQPAVRSLVTVPGPEGLPILGMSKELIGENDGYVNINGVEMATVTVDDKPGEAHALTQVVRVVNQGGAPARLCRVVDAIGTDVIYDSGVLINGAPPVSGTVKLYDAKNAEITNAIITGDSRRVYQAAAVMFAIGDVAPGQTVTIQYRIRPRKMASKEVAKPYREPVALTVGAMFAIPAPALFSGSFIRPIPCPMTDAQGRVVGPTSVSVYSYPVKSSVTFGESLVFNTILRNNSSSLSGGLTCVIKIPVKQALFSSVVRVDPDTGAETAVTNLTTKSAGGQVTEVTVPVSSLPDAGSVILQTRLTMKAQSLVTGASGAQEAPIKLEVNVKTAPSAMPQARGLDEGAGLVSGGTGTTTTEAVAVLDRNPDGPRVFMMKTTLQSAREGDVLPFTITVGNHGKTASAAGTLAILLPAGTDLVTAGAQFTSPGFTPGSPKAGGKLSWGIPSLNPGQVVVRQLAVRLRHQVKRPDDRLTEASCVFQPAGGAGVAAGPTATRILNGNPVVAGLQTLGDGIVGFFRGLGAFLIGQGDPPAQAVQAAASQISSGSTVTQISGADYLTTTSNTIIIPLGGNRVVAAGGGNLIANDGAGIVAGGAGNLIAGGAGRIIAAGAGNLLANDGASLTSNQIASLVGGSSANAINLGAGNLYQRGTNGLIANDGAGLLGTIQTALAGVVAAGGGNIVASGGGNVVAAGGGNIVASGGGNIVASGGGNVANPGSGAQVLVALPGGGLVGGSAQLLANGPAAGIVAGGAGNALSINAGNIVAGGAGN